jgi:hypothetical protein
MRYFRKFSGHATYFTNNKNIIVWNDQLAMGAPSFTIIAEIFLKQTEHSHLTRLTNKHNTVNYFRYVENILLIFYPSHTNIWEARGGAVGCGTALQAGRSRVRFPMVSLDFLLT